MGKPSPTSRTLKLCKKLEWIPYVVEHWNAFAHIRQDLYGGIDLVVLKPGTQGLLGIQATASGTSARKKKLSDLPVMVEWLKAGLALEVWGWRKLKVGKRQLWKPKMSRAYLEDGRVCWSSVPEEELQCLG